MIYEGISERGSGSERALRRALSKFPIAGLEGIFLPGFVGKGNGMKKVLIVDDDLAVLNALAQTVEAWGYSAIKCTNGCRALHVLEDNSEIALLIVDIEMPEMDGRELIREIVQMPTLEHLPIIITSGVECLGQTRDLLDLGASYFVEKPVNMDELKRCTGKLVPAQAEEGAAR